MEACGWCGVTAEYVEEDYWRGHNTRRECRRCGKRWCSEFPRESYEVVETFCSQTCRSRWPRTRKCVTCGKALPLRSRSDRLTCSVRCRVALFRSQNPSL